MRLRTGWCALWEFDFDLTAHRVRMHSPRRGSYNLAQGKRSAALGTLERALVAPEGHDIVSTEANSTPGKTMVQSLVRNSVHLIYSTKHRQPWLTPEVRPRLFAYQAGIFKQVESSALVIGGVEDHVHALFSLSKNLALKDVVQEVKQGSSKWMKTNEGTGNRDFYWQNGYAASR